MAGFVSGFGRAFYGEKVDVSRSQLVVLRRVDGQADNKVEERYALGEQSVVPFWAGKKLEWEIVC